MSAKKETKVIGRKDECPRCKLRATCIRLHIDSDTTFLTLWLCPTCKALLANTIGAFLKGKTNA